MAFILEYNYCDSDESETGREYRLNLEDEGSAVVYYNKHLLVQSESGWIRESEVNYGQHHCILILNDDLWARLVQKMVPIFHETPEYQSWIDEAHQVDARFPDEDKKHWILSDRHPEPKFDSAVNPSAPRICGYNPYDTGLEVGATPILIQMILDHTDQREVKTAGPPIIETEMSKALVMGIKEILPTSVMKVTEKPTHTNASGTWRSGRYVEVGDQILEENDGNLLVWGRYGQCCKILLSDPHCFDKLKDLVNKEKQ